MFGDDLRIIYKNDPAAKGLQPFLYPGLHIHQRGACNIIRP